MSIFYKSTSLAFLFIACTAFSQNLELLPYSSYQKTVKGTYANEENVSDDDGGYIILQLKNNSASVIQVSSLLCKKNTGNTSVAPAAFFAYPNSIQPGQHGVLVIKGSGNPFRENDSIVITVNAQTFRLMNKTPGLKFANLVPDRMLDTLFVYMRNDFADSVIIRNIYVNGSDYDVVNTPGLLVSDSIIPAKGIAIVKIPFIVPLKNCLPVFIGADFKHASSAAGYSGAFARIVEPDFPIGDWWSNSFDPSNEQHRKELRELHISMIHGPSNYALMQKAKNDYFIQTIYSSNFSDPVDTAVAANIIRNQQSADYIKTWSIGDEPDLNGNDIAQQVLKNQTYWNNDSNTPSHVNLSVQRKFNRYGFYSDIVSMDHYAAPPAPNIINLRWVPIVGSPGNIDEALQYTEILKANTEPRRMWSWVQFVTGSYTQDTFAFNTQFWMHVFGGAKGIELFIAQGSTKSDEPAMWREAQNVIYRQSSIRNLCLYGEPYSNIKSSHSKVIARSLVSEKYMVIAAINNSITYSWNGSFSPIKYNASINKNLSYELTFDLPAWIATEEVYMLGDKGARIPVALQHVNGATYKLIPPQNLGTETHIFVIGASDHTKPAAPAGLHVVDQQDSAHYTLSWDLANDNVGVKGYLIKKNGIPTDTAYAPFYILQNGYSPCETTWSVAAFDNSGNISQPAIVTLPERIVPQINIAQQSGDTLITSNDSLNLFVDAAHVDTFQWQQSNDQFNWSDIPNSNNDSLLLLPDVKPVTYYRCILTGLCSHKDTTVLITISRTTITAIHHRDKLVTNLFPDPAENFVQLNFSFPLPGIKIRVTDVYGKIILQQSFSLSASIKLDVSGFSSGMYFIQIMKDDRSQTISFIKQ